MRKQPALINKEVDAEPDSEQDMCGKLHGIESDIEKLRREYHQEILKLCKQLIRQRNGIIRHGLAEIEVLPEFGCPFDQTGVIAVKIGGKALYAYDDLGYDEENQQRNRAEENDIAD